MQGTAILPGSDFFVSFLRLLFGKVECRGDEGFAAIIQVCDPADQCPGQFQ